MTTEERFERIESTLVRITDRMDRMSETHVELETAQVNLQRAQTRIAEESREWRTDFEQKLNASLSDPTVKHWNRANGSAAERPRLSAVRSSRLLAGFLNSENLLSHSLREVDKNELILMEKVVFSTLVDNPHEIVLGCARIRQDSIDLAKNQ